MRNLILRCNQLFFQFFDLSLCIIHAKQKLSLNIRMILSNNPRLKLFSYFRLITLS